VMKIAAVPTPIGDSGTTRKKRSEKWHVSSSLGIGKGRRTLATFSSKMGGGNNGEPPPWARVRLVPGLGSSIGEKKTTQTWGGAVR